MNIGHKGINQLGSYKKLYSKRDDKGNNCGKIKKLPHLMTAYNLKNQLVGGVADSEDSVVRLKRDFLNKYITKIQHEVNNGNMISDIDLLAYEVANEISNIGWKSTALMEEPKTKIDCNELTKLAKEFVEEVIILARHATDSNTKTNWFGITNETSSIQLLKHGEDCKNYLAKMEKQGYFIQEHRTEKPQPRLTYSMLKEPEERQVYENNNEKLQLQIESAEKSIVNNSHDLDKKEEEQVVVQAFVVTDKLGKEVSSKHIALSEGKYYIPPRGDTKGREITISSPVYFFQNVQLDNMKKLGHCMVMKTKDFQELRASIHKGAFGGDYCALDNVYTAVWKHPADLQYIKGFNTPKELWLDVGTYAIHDDTSWSKSQPLIIKNLTANLDSVYTKERKDIKVEDGSGNVSNVVSIHQFRAYKNKAVILPGIATDNFMHNFDKSTVGESKKVGFMIEELAKFGIHACMSNGTHHTIIILATPDTKEGSYATPEELARVLHGEEGGKILEIIQNAAKPNRDMKLWKNAYIAEQGV